ncbi:IMP cyclohydrolase, partial [Candidatus Woesearchaeota archaeon]|nr:IMP cyclohydrolase [Candidatus Woesearchaeota archaeon]
MVEGLENLAKMEYPGRFIILGQDVSGEQGVVVYGVTGRSVSSQARKFVFNEEHEVLRTDVTDKEQLEKGSPALLIYPAIARKGSFVVVSNGAQTSLLYEAVPKGIPGFDPNVSMMSAFKNYNYAYDPKLGWINLTF